MATALQKKMRHNLLKKRTQFALNNLVDYELIQGGLGDLEYFQTISLQSMLLKIWYEQSHNKVYILNNFALCLL